MSRKYVLLVQPDPALRGSIKDLLQSTPIGAELRIIEAENGIDAQQKTINQSFDLMITDLALPKMPGTALIDSMSAPGTGSRPKHILGLSVSPEEIRNRPKASWVTYMVKPFDEDAFKAYLRQTLVGGENRAAASVPAPATAPAGKPVDVSFINPFIDATLYVLETMCSTRPTKEKVFVRTQDQISGDISAIIAMNSSKFRGSMAIAFEKATFLALVGSMLGETYTEITDELQDAAGEICNQVFGQAKKALNEGGHDIQPAIPSIVVGNHHTIKHLVDGKCLVVSFKTPAGAMAIEAVVSSS